MDENEAKQSLSEFLANNPKSEVKRITPGEDEILAVVAPWGDPALAISLDDAERVEEVIRALNGIVFPEQLSALFHRRSKQIEVAWTAYKLSTSNQQVFGRSFIFSHNGTDHVCRFSEASSEFRILAPHFIPIGPSDTNYRNLISFINQAHTSVDGQEDSPFGVPACFFIESIEINDDGLLDFLNSLNFYMSYYDALTPRVVIHPPQSPRPQSETGSRYRHGSFPAKITSRQLDLELLQFWRATDTPEPARRFLYAYRIIEHAAFLFVEAAPRLAVKRALMMPHALDDVAKTADRVLAAVRSSKIDDYGRFEAVMIQTIDASILWDYISKSIDSFSKAETFDGGFELPALIASAQSRDDFLTNGIRSLCGSARKIRNALAHGREDKNATVILPTKANYEKLRPWSNLMVRAAGEIILFEHS